MGVLGKLIKGRLRKKLGINKLQKTMGNVKNTVGSINSKVDSISNAVKDLGTGGVAGVDEVGESAYQTAVTGDVGDNVIQQGGDPLMKPTFDPNTQVAAQEMFGNEIDGSFDRALPGENDMNDLV